MKKRYLVKRPKSVPQEIKNNDEEYFEIVCGLLSFGQQHPKDCVAWLQSKDVDLGTSIALVSAGIRTLETGPVEV